MIQTVAELTIENLSSKPIEFVQLEIDQRFNDHHRMKAVVDLEKIGEGVLSSPLQKAALVNEKVQVDIKEGEDLVNAYTFVGLITDVQIELDKGYHGLMHIFAASTTIELERGKMMQTFSDTDLKSIVGEVTKGLIHLKNIINKPKYSNPIKFSMQYRETDFQYLRRLAWMYGEKFFYTGEALVFGNFDGFPTVNVTYDIELKEVKICTQLIANTVKQYYRTIDFDKSPFEHSLSEGGTFSGEASVKSDKLNLGKKPDMPMDVPVFDDSSLKDITKMRKERNFTDMYHVTGETKLYKICIGAKLEVNFGKLQVEDSLGTLRVIRVRHVFDETGHYFNEFDAVPVKFDRVPFPEIDIPIAHAIPAKVVDNVDPDGLAKVQVKFDFEDKACDYWMPLMQPEAGKGDTLNRGYSFIPEIDDMVLISFFEGNPDFPFIMGSMFHGRNADNLGGGKGNHNKSIIDKSGGQVLFNTDKNGSWGIIIQDQNGDIINIDTKGKNIIITAPESIQLTANNIQLSAATNINFAAGEDLTSTAGKNVSTSAGNNMLDIVRNDYNMMATNITELAKENYQSEADNIKQTSVKDLTIQSTSGKVVKNAKSRIDNNSGSKSTFH